MKHRLVSLLMILASSVVSDADFSIESCALVAGGQTGNAGIYMLEGTIGQCGVNKLYSQNYSIDGGYWSIIAAVQEPGAPELSLRRTLTNTIVISWSDALIGYQLHESIDLNTTNWNVLTNSQSVVVIFGKLEKQVILQTPLGNRYYRLINR